MPRVIVLGLWGICFLPLALVLLGSDFGAAAPANTGPLFVVEGDEALRALSGPLVHVLLEWSAVATAFLVCVLVLAHWRVRPDVTTPIIGFALFTAGSMDAFHTLAATRLIDGTADLGRLIPFAWVLSSTSQAAIICGGVGICLISGQTRWRTGSAFLTVTTILIGMLAYLVVRISAVTTELPRMMFPGALIDRPWDMVPLALWVGGYFALIRPFHRRTESVFSHTLALSVLPHGMASAHLAFGSTALFDSHFHVACFLKIVGYAVPAVGLLIDSVRTYRREEARVLQLARTRDRLERKQAELELANGVLLRRNEELDEFTYVASHDLQEPLRKLVSFSEFLRYDAGGELSDRAEADIRFITDAATRMSTLVTDLLALSRSGRARMRREVVSLRNCVDEALATLEPRIIASKAHIEIDELPTVEGDRTILGQLLFNLLGNAIKFAEPGPPVISITARTEGERIIIGVRDNGIGIAEEYQSRIFAPFKRLHGRSEYEGSGIGLSICRKAVERHGGEIWVDSEPGHGSHFQFSLPTVTTVCWEQE